MYALPGIDRHQHMTRNWATSERLEYDHPAIALLSAFEDGVGSTIRFGRLSTVQP